MHGPGLTILYHNLYDYVGAIFPLVWFLKRFPARKEGLVLAVGAVALWVLFVSSHYFEFFPHMDGVINLPYQLDGYLLFLSLFCRYFGRLGLLWFQLKADRPEPSVRHGQ